MKPGDIAPGRVTRVQPMLVQVVVQEQRGVIYGSAADRVTVGQHVKVRIVEINGRNGYPFTAALVG